MVSLKSSSRIEFKIKKNFLNLFFEELSGIEVLCEHGIFVMILFLFSVIFLKIKIFPRKVVFRNYN